MLGSFSWYSLSQQENGSETSELCQQECEAADPTHSPSGSRELTMAAQLACSLQCAGAAHSGRVSSLQLNLSQMIRNTVKFTRGSPSTQSSLHSVNLSDCRHSEKDFKDCLTWDDPLEYDNCNRSRSSYLWSLY